MRMQGGFSKEEQRLALMAALLLPLRAPTALLARIGFRVGVLGFRAERCDCRAASAKRSGGWR